MQKILSLFALLLFPALAHATTYSYSLDDISRSTVGLNLYGSPDTFVLGSVAAPAIITLDPDAGTFSFEASLLFDNLTGSVQSQSASVIFPFVMFNPETGECGLDIQPALSEHMLTLSDEQIQMQQNYPFDALSADTGVWITWLFFTQDNQLWLRGAGMRSGAQFAGDMDFVLEAPVTFNGEVRAATLVHNPEPASLLLLGLGGLFGFSKQRRRFS